MNHLGERYFKLKFILKFTALLNYNGGGMIILLYEMKKCSRLHWKKVYVKLEHAVWNLKMFMDTIIVVELKTLLVVNYCNSSQELEHSLV